MTKSDLPFGSEFSPSQVELDEVLELAVEHEGDWKAFENAVRVKYFDSHRTTSAYNRGKLANNTKLGMIAYGIYDRAGSALTPFGLQLRAARENPSEMYSLLAKHILVNLRGLTLVQCVRDMQVAGETVDLVKLRQWLEERGVHFPRGGKHPSMMRLWLEKAGVFTEGWRIDEARVRDLVGSDAREIDALSNLSQEQKAYLRTLANIGHAGPLASNEVEHLAHTTYGTKFNEKNLAKDVLYPLRDLGYITLTRGTRRPGRGAKPFVVGLTAKMARDVIEPLMAQFSNQIPLGLRRLVRKPLAVVLTEIGSHNKQVRGLALEALGFKLMRLVDLEYVATRLRASATGGAEVDLVFETDRLVFSRWQVQCKNTVRVNLDDVAKEVGLVQILQSNVIVIVTTGKIGPEARKYANTVLKQTNLCFVMIDGADVLAIAENPTTLAGILLREARNVMQIRKLEL